MNIKEVAKLAGVSTSTVSKVINGKDKDISEKTRVRVLEVVKESNYIPYLKFLEKENLKSCLIGLIIRKDHKEREAIVVGVESAANRHGYHLIVHYIDNTEEIMECVESMIQKKVSGIIIDSEEWFPLGKFEDMTVYLSQTRRFDERQKITFYYRLSEAGRLAAERLMESGHQKIACIIDKKDSSITDGYKFAMHSRNLQIKNTWIYEGESIEDIEKRGIPECLDENITAVICGSWEITYCLCKAADRNRKIVPHELSVIAIGDDLLLKVLGDGVTAVELPAEEVSVRAVECLMKMIQGETHVELAKELNPSILERGSIMEPVRDRQGEKIVVVGSMNLDITIEMSRIPIAGETQIVKSVRQFPGGKGGNQAVGVGKLGGQVYMIGCLGNDMDGKLIYDSLLENHVRTEGVAFDRSMATGKAYINLDKDGESTIAVYQGANRGLNIAHLNRFQHLIQNAKYCLLSLEISEEIAEYAVKCCKRCHTEVILKPSNIEYIKEELLECIDYLVPNEKELHAIVPGERTIEQKAECLRKKGVKNVIVTLGAKGCYVQNAEYSLYVPGIAFGAVDTTGGADSFISALAVYLSEGKELLPAIRFAVYASGISVTRYGAQQSLPDRKAVDVYEDEIYRK
ncbi:MAG: LacI family DNA-binding transcriptional regulator [Lachnospiraceae bacterium]|jgi:ribokinase|nr:LacI family DNA-binding transcriptional regulator [Lachnospiraceae bacterium]